MNRKCSGREGLVIGSLTPSVSDSAHRFKRRRERNAGGSGGM